MRWAKFKFNLSLVDLVLYMGIFFLYAPLALVCYDSFGGTEDVFVHYRELFHGTVILSSLVTTLRIALLSGIIATLIAIVLALLLRNEGKIWSLLLCAYVIFPEIITGLSLSNLLMICGIQSSVHTLQGAYILTGVAYMTPLMIDHLDSVKERDTVLEDAAQDLGANQLQTIIHIVLPRLNVVLVPYFLYVISWMLDDTVYCVLLGGSSVTLPMIILSRMRQGPDPKLNALSSLILLVFVLCVPVYRWLSKILKGPDYSE